MRALKITCGIAVVFTTLHLAHGMHHFLGHDSPHGPLTWAAMALAVVIGILSLIGGFLLLKPEQ